MSAQDPAPASAHPKRRGSRPEAVPEMAAWARGPATPPSVKATRRTPVWSARRGVGPPAARSPPPRPEPPTAPALPGAPAGASRGIEPHAKRQRRGGAEAATAPGWFRSQARGPSRARMRDTPEHCVPNGPGEPCQSETDMETDTDTATDTHFIPTPPPTVCPVTRRCIRAPMCDHAGAQPAHALARPTSDRDPERHTVRAFARPPARPHK